MTPLEAAIHKFATTVIAVLAAAGILGGVAMSAQIAANSQVVRGLQYTQNRILDRMEKFDDRLHQAEKGH